MIYGISDTHFGHKNIIRFCRPEFTHLTTEEMDVELVRRWNETVQPTDTVIHGGDFSLKGAEYTAEILRNLNGTIILIWGNHDRHSKSWFLRNGISEIHDIYEFNGCVFTHKPIETDLTNYHGHIHEKNGFDLKEKYPWYSDRHVNLSCEVINYTPIKLF